MIQETKRDFIENFYMKNYIHRKKGEEIIQQIFEERFLSESQNFQFGVLFGINVSLIVLIILFILYTDFDIVANKEFQQIMPLFRGQILFIMYMLLFAWNVDGWERSRINYKLIFGIKFHYSSIF